MTITERTVVREFAELARHSDEVWTLIADTLIDTRGQAGEPADHLIRALRNA
jgi:hypothetical protein